MESNDWNSPTTKLLTLLNVSAAKSLKLKRVDQHSPPPQKLNKKRRVLDHISPNSVDGVDAELETTGHEVVEPHKDDGGGDAGVAMAVSEAADLSDTEGMLDQKNTHLT
jgi:hypothetical protein